MKTKLLKTVLPIFFLFINVKNVFGFIAIDPCSGVSFPTLCRISFIAIAYIGYFFMFLIWVIVIVSLIWLAIFVPYKRKFGNYPHVKTQVKVIFFVIIGIIVIGTAFFFLVIKINDHNTVNKIDFDIYVPEYIPHPHTLSEITITQHMAQQGIIEIEFEIKSGVRPDYYFTESALGNSKFTSKSCEIDQGEYGVTKFPCEVLLNTTSLLLYEGTKWGDEYIYLVIDETLIEVNPPFNYSEDQLISILESLQKVDSPEIKVVKP